VSGSKALQFCIRVSSRRIAAFCASPTAQRGRSRSPAILMRPMGGSIPFGLNVRLRREHDRTEPFRVPRFHRTLSEWVDLIVEAGLVIERFGEPCVSVELAKAEPALEDTRVAPLFLHIHAIKPRC
jgi:hypothetical protein